MGLNNLPEDTNLSVLISRLEDRIERMERATRTMPSSIKIGALSDAAVPPLPQAIYDSTIGFGLFAFDTVIFTHPVTIPAGYTRAMVIAISRVNAINSTLAADSVVTWTSINGLGANALPSTDVPNNAKSTCISPMTAVLTGLVPGNTFDITVGGGAYRADWAANLSNTLELTALVLWQK